MTLEDSTTYQWILEQGESRGVAKGIACGKLEEVRAVILRLGMKRFGTPSVSIHDALSAIPERERLERIVDRIVDATDWNDLLATP